MTWKWFFKGSQISNQSDIKKPRSLKGHLIELRKRLLKSLFSLLPAFCLSWFFSGRLLNFLSRPIQPFLESTTGKLVFTAPAEQLTAHLQVAFFFAVLLSSPYWMGQVWAFISPGLYKKERKLFLIFWFSAVVLFFLGLCFAYFTALPLIFAVLINFGEGQAFITIKHYLSFVFRFAFALGLSFEMPLVLFFCHRHGLVSLKTLKKHRRHAWLALSVLSAFITPPDVLSFFLLWIPLAGLYELSIQFAGFFNRQKGS